MLSLATAMVPTLTMATRAASLHPASVIYDSGLKVGTLRTTGFTTRGRSSAFLGNYEQIYLRVGSLSAYNHPCPIQSVGETFRLRVAKAAVYYTIRVNMTKSNLGEVR